MTQKVEKRQFLVRFQVGEPAPFYMDTQLAPTPVNFIRYFGSKKFTQDNHITHIRRFLFGVQEMGCTIKEYSYSSDHVEFKVDVPDYRAAEFETENAIYIVYLVS